MKNKKLTALILCFTMLFSITSGIFSAAFASDGTTGSAYSLDTTTDSVYSLDTTTDSADSTDYVWDSTTESAVEEEKGPMLFSTKAKTVEVAEEEATPAPDYSYVIGKTAAFNMDYDSVVYFNTLPSAEFDYENGTDFSSAYYDIFDPPLVEITNWYYDTTGSALWYQVKPLADETLPDGLTTDSWVLQQYIGRDNSVEAVIITDTSIIGKTVAFDKDIIPSLYDGIDGNGYGTMYPVPSAMLVKDLYTNGVDTWYYVDAVEGETWSADYDKYHYVKAKDVVVVEQEDDDEDQVQLSSGGITISGAGIPEGAEVVVSDLTATVNPGDGVSIFDISVQSGETNWQPEPGKTVKVTLPAPAGAEKVNVVHFLEDAQQIQANLGGSVTTIDTSDAEPVLLEVLAKAIAACKEATGQDNMVAVERFENVQVVDGCVKIDSCGFSIYVFWENKYRELPNDWEALEDMNTGTVYYIKQGGEFRLINSKKDNWDDHYWTNIAETVGGSVSRDKSLFGWTKDDIVFKVPDNSSIVGKSFTIRYYVEGEQDKTIEIQVISKDTEVEGIDNESVYIGIYTADGFPSEPTASMNTNYYWYLANGTVEPSEQAYADTAAGLIYKNRFETSSLKIQSGTVTAVVDNSGVSTLQYAKINDNFKRDIITKIMKEMNMTGDANDNTLLIYAVKKIVSGNNVKWYIMAKIVPNNNYILSYDINWPEEIPIPSDAIMPKSGSYQYNAEVTILYPNKIFFEPSVGNKKYEVNFLGWDTDKNAKDPSIEYNEDCQMTMTEDLTLYAVWKTNYEYEKADIEFYNHVVDKSDNTITTNTEFVFTVSESLYKYNYKIYDKAGVLQSNGMFSKDDSQFILAAEQHIIIESVPKNSYEIELISTVGYGVKASSSNGYIIDANGATSINITSETNTTGRLHIDFYNVLQTYTVTYDYNGVTVDGAPANQTYTIENDFELLNPSKSHYTFNGWKVTQKDATSNWNNDIYAGGSSMSNMYGNVTLTAQWTRNTINLTIETTGCYAIDKHQSFIFNINNSDMGIDLDVVLHGNGNVTINELPIDNNAQTSETYGYTIAPKTDWSWRYTAPTSPNISISDGAVTVTFDMRRSYTSWLDGNAWCNILSS